MRCRQNKISLKVLLQFACFFGGASSFAQNKTIDSLKAVIAVQEEDTSKVRNLYSLYWELDPRGDNSKLQIQYGREVLALSKKLNFKSGQGKAYFLLSSAYRNIQDYTNSFNYTDSAIKIFTETKNDFHLSWAFIRSANHYALLGDNASAINYYNQALIIGKQIKNQLVVSQALTAIGQLYSDQGKYDEALQKHFAALKILKAPGFDDEEWGLPYSYQSIGAVYAKRGDAPVAKNEKQNPVTDYTKAMAYYDTAIQLFSRLDNIGALAELSYQTGNIYLKTGQFLSAKKRFQQSLNFYSQTNYKSLIEELYLAMSELDSMNGDYPSAYNHYKLYVAQKEKLNIEAISRKVEVAKLKGELKNKEYQIKLFAAESKLNTQKKRYTYISIAVFIILAGFSTYRFLRKRKLQNQQAILSERLRISQELHDEVGATLSGISMYSHLTKEQMKHAQTAEVEKSLTIIQQSAGEMVNKLNDIVWLINPGQDSLQKLIQRLEEYAGEMAAIKNMQVKITLPEQFSTHSLPVEGRRNIYLFCKEAINNAVKYSEADLLELTVKEYNQLLEISIRDNGKGFDVENVKRGNGLGNMKQRANGLGADFDIQSEPGEGCFISLKLKITQ